jgi:transposase
MEAKDTVDTIYNKYRKITPFLTERARRIWVGTEAESLGYGGQRIVHKATGVAINTIRQGIRELKVENAQLLPSEQVRKKGGGRKLNITKDSSLKNDILESVESSTRGDPEAPLLWCSKSLRNIADTLNKENHRASHTHVGKILEQEGYSLQVNRKTNEGGDNPDRDAQFTFISNKTKDFQSRNQPIISVDTKKKELIGEFKNPGVEYAKKGEAVKVNVYDFIDETKEKASPYGIYDITKNNGWVSVGISADTAEFSVNSIREWWNEMGKSVYSEAQEIYINADGGGSNGSRVRLWKIELQKLANEIGKVIHVSHFPPGTSKWNKIEHKMFCFISKNWRGKPLIDTATIVQLIANTTTKKGLTIRSKLDQRTYEKGIKISDEELAQVNILKNSFHGEWNYQIAPQEYQVII